MLHGESHLEECSPISSAFRRMNSTRGFEIAIGLSCTAQPLWYSATSKHLDMRRYYSGTWSRENGMRGLKSLGHAKNTMGKEAGRGAGYRAVAGNQDRLTQWE